MRVLITGGCGFLGCNLAAALLRDGEDVIVFDNLSRAGSTQNLEWLRLIGDPVFLHGDVRSCDDVDHAVASVKPDAVLHLAGQVAMTTSILQPIRDFRVNSLGTLNVLEAVRAHACSAPVLYSSTNKVYGDLEQYRYDETETRYVCRDRPNGFDESTPLDFRSPYGCSKGAADQYVLDYHHTFGLRTVVFRHSSMYGGRQFATEDQGWVGWFCARARDLRRGESDGEFTISGNGKQVRDLLHADDMVTLYRAALEHIDAAQGTVFNVGGGPANSLSLIELFRELETYAGRPITCRSLPPRQSDQRVFIADISKARQRLHWEPRVDRQTGLARMLEWVEGDPEGQDRP